MSGYSDCWYNLHKGEIEKERKAQLYRNKMISELSSDEMIRIMFSDFIEKKGTSYVTDVGRIYFRELEGESQ